MGDSGKTSLGQKFKNRLHIGSSHKSSASDVSDYSNQVSRVYRAFMLEAVKRAVCLIQLCCFGCNNVCRLSTLYES